MTARLVLGPDVTSDIAGLAKRLAEWVLSRGALEALRMFAQCLYQDGSWNAAGGVANNYFAQLERDGFWAWLATSGLGLDLEAPVVKYFDGTGCDGAEPLRLTKLAIDRARSVGCAPRKVSGDEPLQATECGLTLEQTAERTAAWIAELRAYGQHDVALTFAYRRNTVDEIIRFMELVQQWGAPRGVWTSPTDVDVDFDPNSVTDQFPPTFFHPRTDLDHAGPELQKLHATCAAWGVPLRMIPTCRGNDPASYRRGIAACIQYIRTLLGHDPDGWTLESWKGVEGGLPVNLPETDARSHTGLVLDLVNGNLAAA